MIVETIHNDGGLTDLNGGGSRTRGHSEYRGITWYKFEPSEGTTRPAPEAERTTWCKFEPSEGTTRPAPEAERTTWCKFEPSEGTTRPRLLQRDT